MNKTWWYCYIALVNTKKPNDDIQYLYKILHITILLFRNNNKTISKNYKCLFIKETCFYSLQIMESFCFLSLFGLVYIINILVWWYLVEHWATNLTCSDLAGLPGPVMEIGPTRPLWGKHLCSHDLETSDGMWSICVGV